MHVCSFIAMCDANATPMVLRNGQIAFRAFENGRVRLLGRPDRGDMVRNVIFTGFRVRRSGFLEVSLRFRVSRSGFL